MVRRRRRSAFDGYTRPCGIESIRLSIASTDMEPSDWHRPHRTTVRLWNLAGPPDWDAPAMVQPALQCYFRFMLTFVVHLVLSAALLVMVANLVSGFVIQSWGAAIVAA